MPQQLIKETIKLALFREAGQAAQYIDNNMNARAFFILCWETTEVVEDIFGEYRLENT